jgi:transcriptional regulator with XRE-family HTH domain
MKRDPTDVDRFANSSSKRRRLLRQEELILDVTELLSGALEERHLTKSDLAEKLGKTKGFVTQVLSGNRNLTLRTIADIADALAFRIRMRREKLPGIQTAPARESRASDARKPKILHYG